MCPRFSACGLLCPSRLRKNSALYLILGGAAPQRCDNCVVLNAALATEVTLSIRVRVFPQPAGFSPLQSDLRPLTFLQCVALKSSGTYAYAPISHLAPYKF